MRPEDFSHTLSEARAGKGLALGALFHDLHPRILRYLRALEPFEAEDLASDTWLDVTSALDVFEGDERALRAFALSVARNRILDLRPDARRTIPPAGPDLREDEVPVFEIDPIDEVDDDMPVVAVDDHEIAEIATDAALDRVAALPRDQADVLLLTILGDLSVDEVAGIVGTRPDTVRVIQHQALVRLFNRAARERVSR